MSSPLRALAFYLPQFHPVPENDEWWGPGFTEWTNTAKARPLFPGHYQPHVPADLGFYDLRCPESREAQADLARRYGIAGFLYWHYWFAGRRMLDRPFREVLASGAPDFPFCLAWANQTWTGIWHGAADRILVEQTYPGAEDDQAHFDSLLPAFRDRRYLTVAGKPLFYVFRPEELPNAAAFVERWQDMARAAGFDGLFLVAEVSDLHGYGPAYLSPAADGFDAGAYMRLPAHRSRASVLRMRALRKLSGPEVLPYASRPLPIPTLEPGARLLPTVYPNWDNSPRSGRKGVVLHGATPERFRAHVRAAVHHVRDVPAEERLLFIKSWNEWAEGNHLEPDLRHSTGFLEAVRDELAGASWPE